MERIPDWIQAVVAVIAAAVAAREYFKHRRESRSELAQEVIERLGTDELLFFAVTTLDWGGGLMPVPPSWQPFAGASRIEFNLELVQDAMRPKLSNTTAKDPVRLLYRHAFVHLFNHLERIAYLVRDGSIELGDLANLAWVSKHLLSWEYAPPEIREKIFKEPIDDWFPDGILYSLLRGLAA